MPSSQYYHISKIMEMIISLDRKSVLDIGSGFGKFGVLCREYLELWDGRQKYEFNQKDRRRRSVSTVYFSITQLCL